MNPTNNQETLKKRLAKMVPGFMAEICPTCDGAGGQCASCEGGGLVSGGKPAAKSVVAQVWNAK